MWKYTFERYEIKYILNFEQYNKFLMFIDKYLEPDPYGKSTIQSLYFDTSNDLLIRNSLEKPLYKEKLRLRTYGLATFDKPLFLEIKKKYNDIVYKRRIPLNAFEANEFINSNKLPKTDQISKEINYFSTYYKNLKPAILLIYDRSAYCDKDLRITFDSNIRYRTKDFDMTKSLEGKRIIKDDLVVMEIKTSTALPMWLVRYLSENQIYNTGFSKYKEAYKIIKTKKEETKKWNNFSNQFLAKEI